MLRELTTGRRHPEGSFDRRTITVENAGRVLRVELRRLSTIEEYRQAEDLQTRIWGPEDVVRVPALVLITAQENGGMVVGAFDGPGLVGFVCSYPGRTQKGRFKQTSQLLAVDPDFQHSGIGYHLKLFQREITLEQGLDLITWTFDPLVSVNAHFNLRKLGCIASCYRNDFYGTAQTGLNSALPTDRLLAEWWVREPWLEKRLAGVRPPLPETAPRVNEVVLRPGSGLPENRRLHLDLQDPVLLVEIPREMAVMKRTEIALARSWRSETREIFQRYFGLGYQASDFQSLVRDGRDRSCYVLRRDPRVSSS